MFLKLLELIDQDNCRNNGCNGIGNRYADPDTQRAEETGKNNQARNQEQHLAGERQKDSLLRHADRKEEVCCNHLEADNRENGKDDMQAIHRCLNQLVVGGKQMNNRCRE